MDSRDSQQILLRLRERLSDRAMLDLTKRLIAIPSENPPGNQYEECARTLVAELETLNFDDVRREGACVLASAGTGPRTLYFSGHFDVVPAQNRDQFQPRVEGQNLFGRGSSDMKSGLAAMIYAAAAARDEGLLTCGRIGIVLVPDEESAGPRGSSRSCLQLFLSVAICRYCPECTFRSHLRSPHGFDLFAALTLGITAGFCEEVLFRAYLMTQFAEVGYGKAMQTLIPGL